MLWPNWPREAAEDHAILGWPKNKGRKVKGRAQRKGQYLRKHPLPPSPCISLRLAEPYLLTLSTTLNDSGLGLMGQVSVLEMSTIHVDEGN